MPLTDIDTVTSYLNLANPSSGDIDFINTLITNTQSIIENYSHRKFDAQAYTGEQHIVNHKIFTNQYPIISVEKIVRYDAAVITFITEPESYQNYRIFPSYIELIDLRYVTMTNKYRYLNHEESYCEVSYHAGYTTIPADLQMAATELVALKYKESRENRLGVTAVHEGAISENYSATSMPLSVSSVLDRYKKVRC